MSRVVCASFAGQTGLSTQGSGYGVAPRSLRAALDLAAGGVSGVFSGMTPYPADLARIAKQNARMTRFTFG